MPGRRCGAKLGGRVKMETKREGEKWRKTAKCLSNEQPAVWSMLIFLWIQIYLSKQRGLTTNGRDADGRPRLKPIKAAEWLHSLDEPKIIIYPVNIGVVCMQFSSFSSHPVNLICLSGCIFYRARWGTYPGNSLLCEIMKRFYGWKDFFFFFYSATQNKTKADIQKDIVGIDAFWIS